MLPCIPELIKLGSSLDLTLEFVVCFALDHVSLVSFSVSFGVHESLGTLYCITKGLTHRLSKTCSLQDSSAPEASSPLEAGPLSMSMLRVDC